MKGLALVVGRLLRELRVGLPSLILNIFFEVKDLFRASDKTMTTRTGVDMWFG